MPEVTRIDFTKNRNGERNIIGWLDDNNKKVIPIYNTLDPDPEDPNDYTFTGVDFTLYSDSYTVIKQKAADNGHAEYECFSMNVSDVSDANSNPVKRICYILDEDNFKEYFYDSDFSESLDIGGTIYNEKQLFDDFVELVKNYEI